MTPRPDPGIRCWFEIRSAHPDPAVITAALGVSPTEAWRAGEGTGGTSWAAHLARCVSNRPRAVRST